MHTYCFFLLWLFRILAAIYWHCSMNEQWASMFMWIFVSFSFFFFVFFCFLKYELSWHLSCWFVLCLCVKEKKKPGDYCFALNLNLNSNENYYLKFITKSKKESSKSKKQINAFGFVFFVAEKSIELCDFVQIMYTKCLQFQCNDATATVEGKMKKSKRTVWMNWREQGKIWDSFVLFCFCFHGFYFNRKRCFFFAIFFFSKQFEKRNTNFVLFCFWLALFSIYYWWAFNDTHPLLHLRRICIVNVYVCECNEGLLHNNCWVGFVILLSPTTGENNCLFCLLLQQNPNRIQKWSLLEINFLILGRSSPIARKYLFL